MPSPRFTPAVAIVVAMRQVLIGESHADVRDLLVRMVVRLGYEPRLVHGPLDPRDLRGVALAIVEPADPANAVIAKALALARPSLPIISVSVLANPRIDVPFCARLMKPFTFEQLAAAMTQALADAAVRPAAA